jgi:hypothetical protein
MFIEDSQLDSKSETVNDYKDTDIDTDIDTDQDTDEMKQIQIKLKTSEDIKKDAIKQKLIQIELKVTELKIKLVEMDSSLNLVTMFNSQRWYKHGVIDKPNVWILPNNVNFPLFMYNKFNHLRIDDASYFKRNTDSTEKKMYNYQQMIGEYLSPETPYRGILAYHQLGSGKTRTAIETSKRFAKIGMKTMVLLPASLKSNFEKEINKYDNGNLKNYTFVSVNSSNIKKFKTDDFNNKLIIFDEFHRYISIIKNYKNKKAIPFYTNIMNAKNSKILALSGEPIINNPFELAIGLNILRGYYYYNKKDSDTVLDASGTINMKKNEIGKLFPDKQEEFDVIYGNLDDPLQLIQFKNRVLGNVSYFSGVSEKRFPKLIEFPPIILEMTESMEFYYDTARDYEIELEKNIEKRKLGVKMSSEQHRNRALALIDKNVYSSPPNLFKFYSRSFSNFVFPKYLRNENNQLILIERPIKFSFKTKIIDMLNTTTYFDIFNLDYKEKNLNNYLTLIFIPKLEKLLSLPEKTKNKTLLIEIKKTINDIIKADISIENKYNIIKEYISIDIYETILTHLYDEYFELNKLKFINFEEDEDEETETTINENKMPRMNKFYITKTGNLKQIINSEKPEKDKQYTNYLSTILKLFGENLKKKQLSIDDLKEYSPKIALIIELIKYQKAFSYYYDTFKTNSLMKKPICTDENKQTIVYNKLFEELDDDKLILYNIVNNWRKLSISEKENYQKIANKQIDPSITSGPVYIYSNFKTIEGIGAIKTVLESTDYKELFLSDLPDKITKLKKEKRFFLFTGDITSKPELTNKFLNLFNSKENRNGEYIQIVLGTSASAEGIDLHQIRQVHILEPFWHPVRTAQVKGRARRIDSHINLDESERRAFVFEYLVSKSPVCFESPEEESELKVKQLGGGNNYLSTDLLIYLISKKKSERNDVFKQALRESSIDCLLYKNYNEMNIKKEIPCVIYKPTNPITLKGDEVILYDPDYNLDKKIEQIKFVPTDKLLYSLNNDFFRGSYKTKPKCNTTDKYCIENNTKTVPIFYNNDTKNAYPLYDATIYTKFGIVSHVANALYINNEVQIVPLYKK